MKTIAILSQKGGAGKTTLAINLAVMAEQSLNGGVTLIDLDPQASAAHWREGRTAPSPSVIAAQAEQLSPLLDHARQTGMQLVILDTAPHSENAALAAACAADLVLIPCRPAILDLRAIGQTIALAKQAGTQGAVVLNAVAPRGTLADEAAEAIAGYGVTLAPVRLTHRSAFIHALTCGEAIQEFEPRGKGASEIERLFGWIKAFVVI